MLCCNHACFILLFHPLALRADVQVLFNPVLKTIPADATHATCRRNTKGLYMLKKGATLNIGFDWTRTQGYKNADPWKNAHVHPNTGFGVASLNSLDTTSAFTFRTEKWEGHNQNHNDWRVYTGKVSRKRKDIYIK